VTWAGDALFAGSPDERFEAGLAMLLDGIERRAERAVARQGEKAHQVGQVMAAIERKVAGS